MATRTTSTRSKPKASTATKPYWEMSSEELAAATSEYDKPVSKSKMRPLSKKALARFRMLQKSPSHSIYVTKWKNAVNVLQLDSKVLDLASQYADQHKLSLSDLVNRGLERLLAEG